MKRDELIQRLAKLAIQDAEEAVCRERELHGLSGPVHAGDLLVVSADATIIHWLVVKPHPDDPHLLFTVPADDNPEVGPADVAVTEEHACGPLTLRCGSGLWIESNFLDPKQRAGRVGEDVLHSVAQCSGSWWTVPSNPTQNNLLSMPTLTT